MVDTEGYKAVDRLAQQTQRAVLRGQHAQATLLWSQTELAISRVTQGVSFYNILDKMPAKAFARVNAADNHTGGAQLFSRTVHAYRRGARA